MSKSTDSRSISSTNSQQREGEARKAARISFEVFPPYNAQGQEKLLQVARDLECFEPAFFSVTYGAGGSGQDKTFATLEKINRETQHHLAGHLTCVGASKAQTDAVAARYRQMGVNHIVALRGDKPKDADVYTPHPQGYAYARDLVEGLKKTGGFEISVAAYPESHPESASPSQDLDNLKGKFDAGADRAISQFFFENDLFYRFQDAAFARGIGRPIVPGILLINDFTKMTGFAKMCQASVPQWLHERFAGLENDPETHRKVAIEVAIDQVGDLRAHGVEDFHFYTMNRSDLAIPVCQALGAGQHRDQAPATPSHKVA